MCGCVKCVYNDLPLYILLFVFPLFGKICKPHLMNTFNIWSPIVYQIINTKWNCSVYSIMSKLKWINWNRRIWLMVLRDFLLNFIFQVPICVCAIIFRKIHYILWTEIDRVDILSKMGEKYDIFSFCFEHIVERGNIKLFHNSVFSGLMRSDGCLLRS